MAIKEGILLGMGNPLLDLCCHVDQSFLEKYGLKPNDAILADDKHKPMYQDMEETYKNIEYIPGGATQNSMKFAQWLLKGQKNVATFMGCVGNHDHFGKILEEKARAIGVNTRYQYDLNEPTGTCAVLLTDSGKNRSLCAYLAAANCFKESHLDVPENWDLVEKAEFYYISGYFLTVSPPTIQRVAKHACEKNKLFAMNLSAPFLCEFFKEPMMAALPYTDLVFGNESEAITFAKVHGFDTDSTIEKIAMKISELPKKNGRRKRMVVITQGDDPVIVINDGKAMEYPVPYLAPEKIIDTNGAGDAFVGGFLSQLIQGKSIDECVKCANYAGCTVIQRSGCTFPETPDLNFIC